MLADGAVSVGGALGWATRAGVDVLHLIGDAADGATLRQVGHFAIDADVWRSEGAGTLPVTEPAPTPSWPMVDDDLMALAGQLTAAGADAIVEEGVLRGEVLGLEVARVTRDDDGHPRLEIGVGRNDRAAHALLGTTDLAGVVRQVRAQRSADAPSSPATTGALDRWLRAVVMAAWDLEPVQGAVAAARGSDVLVVCSVGVEPDLVPKAADLRGDERLVLVMPEGDDLPVTRRLAALLHRPAEVRTVSRHWRRSLQ